MQIYVEKEIFPKDPFSHLDREGVGFLVKMATENGRNENSELHVGICGEHGGDPESIDFAKVNLDYVSCSPFRVPIARLAARGSNKKVIKKTESFLEESNLRNDLDSLAISFIDFSKMIQNF